MNALKFRVTDGNDGRCLGEFAIAKDHLNAYGILNGGYTATIIDNITTYALMSTNSHPGVSIDMYVNYLKSAKEGEKVIVEANTAKMGKSLAFVECVLKYKSDGFIIVKGGQTKFVDFKENKFLPSYMKKVL